MDAARSQDLDVPEPGKDEVIKKKLNQRRWVFFKLKLKCSCLHGQGGEMLLVQM